MNYTENLEGELKGRENENSSRTSRSNIVEIYRRRKCPDVNCYTRYSLYREQFNKKVFEMGLQAFFLLVNPFILV